MRVGVLERSSILSCATSSAPESFPLFAGFFGATCASLADVFPVPMLRPQESNNPSAHHECSASRSTLTGASTACASPPARGDSSLVAS